MKSIFVIEDETEQANASSIGQSDTKDSTNESSEVKSEINIERPVFDENNPHDSNPDEKFINRLLGAIEENNLKGFDYLEYKQALQNLEKVDMDEATKFKSALAVAKTMGANKPELLSSGEHYLKVLEKEEKKFIEAFKNQVNKQVNGRNQEISLIEKEIESKQAQIKKLQEDIEQYKKKLKKSRSSIESAQSKVEAAKTGFYSAYYIVAEQIKDDLTKIKKYLD